MGFYIFLLVIIPFIAGMVFYYIGKKDKEKELFLLYRNHLLHKGNKYAEMNCTFCEEEKTVKILNEVSKKTDKPWEEKVGSALKKEEKPGLSKQQQEELKQSLKNIKSK